MTYTKEQIEKFSIEILAYESGMEIEYFIDNFGWVLTGTPIFDLSVKYRVKPKQ